MYDVAVQLISDTYIAAFPIACFIGLVDLVITSFLRAALGGKLWFGK